MTNRRPHIALPALLCGAALAAGCGGSDEPEGRPIPRELAQSLNRELDAVQNRFDAGGGACGDIEDRSEPDVERLLAQIPSNVDPDVRRALRRSFDRLWQLAGQQCNDTEPEPETETQPEPEPEPVPTETVPVPTETVPPETETQPGPEPQPTQPQQPPGNGNGNGNGNGGAGNNGNGNGGGADFDNPGKGDG